MMYLEIWPSVSLNKSKIGNLTFFHHRLVIKFFLMILACFLLLEKRLIFYNFLFSFSLPYTCFLLNGDMKLHRNWHLFI
jgi:hypothetical protein